MSNIVRAGMNIWGAYGNGGGTNIFKDGGPVRLNGGGYVQKMAGGGMAGQNRGFVATPQIQASPPMGGRWAS